MTQNDATSHHRHISFKSKVSSLKISTGTVLSILKKVARVLWDFFFLFSQISLSAFLKVKKIYRIHQCPDGTCSLMMTINKSNVFYIYEMIVTGCKFLKYRLVQRFSECGLRIYTGP